MRDHPACRRRGRLPTRVAAALLTLGVLASLGTAATTAGPAPAADARQAAPKPNIVFVLTDDLSKNLVKHMPAVRGLRSNGTSFRNYFVADGLCCPSRASILTGKYPHNTHVRVNENNRGGGYRAFVRHGNQRRTYAVPLDKAGYRTGYMGKYMNGYKIGRHVVPRGWDEWHVSSGGYSNVGGSYAMTRVTRKGAAKNIGRPKAYLNDALGKRVRAFVNRAHRNGQPFFLQLSSFAPHSRVAKSASEPRFPPAMRDRPKNHWPGGQYPRGDCGRKPGGGRYDCKDLHVPRGTGFDEATYRKLDRDLRNRVRMMQSLNDQLVKLRKRLIRNGQFRNTYFVFSSDNGFHLGNHGLLRGKGSAYDHDTSVPLIVRGPGVAKGAVRNQVTQNVDLYATFQRMARLTPKQSNGRSLVPLLDGDGAAGWRRAALFEHKAQQHGSASDPDLADDDAGSAARAGYVPAHHPYNAIRTRGWLYVNYLDSDRRELYNLRKDPRQRNNVYSPGHPQLDRLKPWLRRYVNCGGGDGQRCWRAGHP